MDRPSDRRFVGRALAGCPRTVVVGLGNPVLGDDGVGWCVADAVEEWLRAAAAAGLELPPVAVERLGVGGLRLMEFLTGFDEAIVVDAADFAERPAGEVRARRFEEMERRAVGRLDSVHDVSLAAALELGRRAGAELPATIWVVTVVARMTGVFSEALTPPVEAAVPIAAGEVVRLLGLPRADDWPIPHGPGGG
jgi:hydrogenase maturation protease